MEIIKQLQKELKIKIEETKNNKEFEELENNIIDLIKKITKQYKNKYKLNMIYNNIDVESY
jgi:hypothetical protein